MIKTFIHFLTVCGLLFVIGLLNARPPVGPWIASGIIAVALWNLVKI